MKNKLYYLASCSTCARINKELNAEAHFEMQNIKEQKITAKQLGEMAKMAGSYESLFSRRAMKYKSMGLKDQQLKEADYRKLILDEYTFLKRPVMIIDNEIFVGNSKKNVEAAKQKLNG